MRSIQLVRLPGRADKQNVIYEDTLVFLFRIHEAVGMDRTRKECAIITYIVSGRHILSSGIKSRILSEYSFRAAEFCLHSGEGDVSGRRHLLLLYSFELYDIIENGSYIHFRMSIGG